MGRSNHEANRLWAALGVVLLLFLFLVVVDPFAAEPVAEDPFESQVPQAPVAAVLYDLATRNIIEDPAANNGAQIDEPAANVPVDDAKAASDPATANPASESDEVLDAGVEALADESAPTFERGKRELVD